MEFGSEDIKIKLINSYNIFLKQDMIFHSLSKCYEGFTFPIITYGMIKEHFSFHDNFWKD